MFVRFCKRTRLPKTEYGRFTVLWNQFYWEFSAVYMFFFYCNRTINGCTDFRTLEGNSINYIKTLCGLPPVLGKKTHLILLINLISIVNQKVVKQMSWFFALIKLLETKSAIDKSEELPSMLFKQGLKRRFATANIPTN